MESDLTYDRFMELQEQNVDKALDTGFALINGQMPITTDYNDITEEFILENTNKKHMALAYSTMKEFAAKNITINHKEDMDSIIIEEPMFLMILRYFPELLNSILRFVLFSNYC